MRKLKYVIFFTIIMIIVLFTLQDYFYISTSSFEEKMNDNYALPEVIELNKQGIFPTSGVNVLCPYDQHNTLYTFKCNTQIQKIGDIYIGVNSTPFIPLIKKVTIVEYGDNGSPSKEFINAIRQTTKTLNYDFHDNSEQWESLMLSLTAREFHNSHSEFDIDGVSFQYFRDGEYAIFSVFKK